MKKTFLLFTFLSAAFILFAQTMPSGPAKKTTSSATVSFDATTAKDALPKAENKTVIGSLDTRTGDVAFEAAVKNFAFSSPRMQEHFNGPNWMNSDQYPRFTFTGQIEKMNKINLKKEGTYKAKVIGDLTIRDVTQKTKVEGTITVTGNKILVTADFSIKLSDFNITSQQPIESGKVSKEPKISVMAEF